VFQESSNDARHANIVADSLDARLQAANSAHQQIHLHAACDASYSKRIMP